MAELPADWGDSNRIPEAYDLAEGIERLTDRYGKLVRSPEVRSQALNGVIEVAKRLSATRVWFEWEYVDPDWRDEFATFYATVYREVPDRCERIHFLREEPFKYLGFVSMRPLLGAPISRTMLAPPEDVVPALAADVPVRAHPWGLDFAVRTFPYISQDRQLGRCAHANVWMVALYFHQLHHTRRVYLSHIAKAADGAPSMGRPVPSSGLSIQQMSAALREVGLPAVHYRLDQLPPDETMQSVVCRYLNSHFPVLLISERDGSPFAHVTVLIGYGRDAEGNYFFIRHDDERGPYQRVQPLEVADDKGVPRWMDPETGRWTHILAPMPGKIYMTGEETERLVRRIVLPQIVDDYAQLSYVLDGLAPETYGGSLRLRTYAIESWRYKNEAGRRGVGIARREVLVRRGMPRFVWVTEVQSCARAGVGKDCVIAEFVVDATANPETAGILYGTLPGLQLRLTSLEQQIKYEDVEEAGIDYFTSGTAVHW